MDFLVSSAAAVFDVNPTSPLFSRHVNLLESLASGLRNLPEDPEAGPSPDYLFFASFAYIDRLLIVGSDVIATETGRDLILAILQYRERVIPRRDIEDRFYNSYGYGWQFDFNWPKFVDLARDLGILVHSLAQEMQTDLAPLKSAEIHEEPDRPSGGAVVEVLDDHHTPICSSSNADIG